jgi:8-oxo-dGTP pyrophosphatase MutT (NUDIX family)
MRQFVLCYAESIDNPDTDWIVLINKINPPGQVGNLNLPGGKIEPGEEVFDAACRELEGETSLKAERDQCELLGTMHGIDWFVSVVLCRFKGPFSVQYGGDERPVVISLREALCMGSRVLPELRTIIPLCISRQPWQMILSEDHNWFNYVLQVNEA